MQLIPFLQSSVLRTVGSLRGTGDGRVAFPCVRVMPPLAGPESFPRQLPTISQGAVGLSARLGLPLRAPPKW